MDNLYSQNQWQNKSSKNALFNTAFQPMPQMQINGYDPKSMFHNHSFNNYGNLMHNNLDKNILNEEIREYSVMIDSKDRNYQIYPDPFTYEVRFNPLPKKREKINGKTVIYEDPNPTINDNFTNVKYIKLETIILPFYRKVRLMDELDEDNEEIVKKWKVDQTKNLTDNLYTILSIGEYTDTNYRSTNDVLAESFATIYYDSKISNSHFRGKTSKLNKDTYIMSTVVNIPSLDTVNL